MSLADFLHTAFDAHKPRKWPLSDEQHVAAWQNFPPDQLRTMLVQLNFPVEAGISQTAPYQLVVKRGQSAEIFAPHPPAWNGSVNLTLHPSIAGRLPVIELASRDDFEFFVRAILHKNEPALIPNSQGACMIAGYNNWTRIHAHRRRWEASQHDGDWQAEFKRLLPQKTRYQDRFLILCRWPYSGVSAENLNLAPAEWLDISHTIRLEHECAHYFTKRVFGTMRKHLHDELLADYAGIVGGIGRFRADWFLLFMGLEAYPTYRKGGRLENYLDADLMQQPNFAQVCETLIRAAQTLEAFDNAVAAQHRDVQGRGDTLLAIAQSSLAQLAAPDGLQRLTDRFNHILDVGKHNAVSQQTAFSTGEN